MVNEMLRVALGDDIFRKAYSRFYYDNKFKNASWDDIRKSFEEVSKKDLSGFFDQWINRKGAPELVLSEINTISQIDKFELKFTLSQVQEEAQQDGADLPRHLVRRRDD